jgi:hypothetical protein
MAIDTIITNAAAIAACNAIVDLLDGGSIKIYDVGSGIPADADEAISDQTLLAEPTFGTPAFGDAADDTGKATATANAISSDTTAAATGTAAFFRACTSAGAAVIQGTCGTATSDLILNSVSITADTEVAISAYTFSVPEQA